MSLFASVTFTLNHHHLFSKSKESKRETSQSKQTFDSSLAALLTIDVVARVSPKILATAIKTVLLADVVQLSSY